MLLYEPKADIDSRAGGFCRIGTIRKNVMLNPESFRDI